MHGSPEHHRRALQAMRGSLNKDARIKASVHKKQRKEAGYLAQRNYLPDRPSGRDLRQAARDQIYEPYIAHTLVEAIDKTDPSSSPITVRHKDGSTEIIPSLSMNQLARIVTGREPISIALRTAVLHRDEQRCRYCRRKPRKIHLDHVYPVALGGPTTYENLVVACVKCNLEKGIDLWTPIPLGEMLL